MSLYNLGLVAMIGAGRGWARSIDAGTLACRLARRRCRGTHSDGDLLGMTLLGLERGSCPELRTTYVYTIDNTPFKLILKLYYK